MISRISYRPKPLPLPHGKIETRFTTTIKHLSIVMLPELARTVAAQVNAPYDLTLRILEESYDSVKQLVGEGHIVDLGVIGKLRLDVYANSKNN